MARWHGQQIAAISARPPLPPTRTYASAAKDAPKGDIETRIAVAMEHLRVLHEDGEIEWTDVSPQAAYEMAFLDD